MVVRLGLVWAKRYHAMLVIGGATCLILFTAANGPSLLAWAYAPVLLIHAVHLIKVLRASTAKALDAQLKVLALATFFTALAFSLVLILA
jgi:1,4-dihydroxy-2-naphthoate polyprenyltransferase